MNYIDYILLILTLIGFILGYRDGLIRKLVGVGGLILAVYFTVKYSSDFGTVLAPHLSNEMQLARIVAGILIFLGTIAFFSIIKRLIHPADKVNKFINQFLGGIAGALQILVFLSGILLFTNVLNFPSEKDKDESIFYSSVYSIVPTAIDLFTGSDFKTEGFLKDYVKSKDKDTIPDTLIQQQETTKTTIPDSAASLQLDSVINND